jgi:hypothetical protein
MQTTVVAVEKALSGRRGVGTKAINLQAPPAGSLPAKNPEFESSHLPTRTVR